MQIQSAQHQIRQHSVFAMLRTLPEKGGNAAKSGNVKDEIVIISNFTPTCHMLLIVLVFTRVLRLQVTLMTRILRGCRALNRPKA